MPIFSQESKQEQSQALFQKAYACQMKGELEKAISLYQRSIDLHPSAEAHTFLGWTYSYQERFHEAIDECLLAIKIDPDYGNPYNDIGSYLLHLNQLEEAANWFERAVKAPRYESRVFAWFNLGKVSELRYDQLSARQYYSQAMETDPSYLPAWQAYVRLCASLN
jgi:Tfp pilus assembly protein PilF